MRNQVNNLLSFLKKINKRLHKIMDSQTNFEKKMSSLQKSMRKDFIAIMKSSK